MTRLTIILTVTCFFALSCTTKLPSGARKIVSDDLFELLVPSNYKLTTSLHDYAPLQLQSADAKTYIIGLREEKSETSTLNLRLDLAAYAHFAADNVSKSLDSVSRWFHTDEIVGGLASKYTEITGTRRSDKLPLEVVYAISVIETPGAWYQIISWTSCNNAATMRNDMQLMACSFRETTHTAESTETVDGGAQAGE